MAKRKATFTKETAVQNRAMIRRAKALLTGVQIDTVANDHPGVKERLKAEFPKVTDTRIVARMAQAIRQLRIEKYYIMD